jgi:4a-hydroxytetrahydrobiopterin dehydratase
MSEQGWRNFLAADGVEDWVVLHGGPTAVFRASSLAEAAHLAAAVAEIPGIQGTRAVLTVSPAGLSVRLNREIWGTEARHVDLARAISAVARDRGLVADRRAVQEVQVAIASKPESLDVGFWRAALGYETMAPDNGIDPLGHGSTFWMQDLDPGKPLRHAMHVDVSVSREEISARVAAAVAAGGRIVVNEPGTAILADRAGNKVCITAWPDGSAANLGGVDSGEAGTAEALTAE